MAKKSSSGKHKQKLTRRVTANPDPQFLGDPAEFQAHLDDDQLQAARGAWEKIPAPRRSPPVMGLAQIIGAEEVEVIRASGKIVFHAAGDTGKGKHSEQTEVVDLMRADYDPRRPVADQPAFWFHLGDVVYGANKAGLYRDQFYRPNNKYPGKIVAVPGNHDAETLPDTDPKSLAAFRHNFVAKRARRLKIAGSAVREAMTQPGVYFLLDAPFVRVLGMYTNAAEEVGVIAGPDVGDAQMDFLVEQLQAVAEERAAGGAAALVVVTHHPPYSAGDHPGSKRMLEDFDDAFRRAGVAPDMFLSGHAHNYQRFTRTFAAGQQAMEIPFLVVGGGGHGATPIKLREDGTPVKTPLNGVGGEVSLRQYYNGYGYLLLTATDAELTAEFYSSPPTGDGPTDAVTVDLRAHKIVRETAPLDHPLAGESRRHAKHKRRHGG